jgi:thiol-disulfide isomerase/thioredoxin
MLKLNKIFAAVLYTALSITAIAAHGFDRIEVEALREDKMRNLVFHETPQPVSQQVFTDPSGTEFTLADYTGKYVVLNFWATWCAPCRKEMPELNALSEKYGSETFEVVTIASGHNPLPAISKFYADTELNHLPVLLDAKSRLSREMKVLSLPITVILAPDGTEIARMKGDADWFSASAQNIVEALLAEAKVKN